MPPTGAGDMAPEAAGPRGGFAWIENRSILTPTGGYLAPGFTHTLNAYSGCAFAGSLCGVFCYAQHSAWVVRGRRWGLYGAKLRVREAYRADHDRLRKRGEGARLAIFMSSATDPYVPQEARLGLTRGLLEEMLDRPPDALVIQTHHTLIERDAELIERLAARTRLWVSITIETDRERIEGFPPHACSPAKRIAVLERFRARGVLTQATLSPLLPLLDPLAFAARLEAACDRVILDHYLIGDGSPAGARTRRTSLVERLIAAGFESWTQLDVLWQVRDIMASVLGRGRVLIGREGFSTLSPPAAP